MSAIDDAVAALAAARAAYDAANTARYNAQMAETDAGAALGDAQAALDSAIADQVATINTAEVLSAAKDAAVAAISAAPVQVELGAPIKVG